MGDNKENNEREKKNKEEDREIISKEFGYNGVILWREGGNKEKIKE